MFENLIDISIKLSSEKNLDSLLNLIVQNATEFLNCERSTVFILDETKGELFSKVGVGIDSKEIRFPLNIGIAGYVARTRESLITNSPYDHPLFNKEIDSQTGFVTKNILAVPMVNVEDKIIGVFQALNKISGSFTQNDEYYAKAFASVAAVAIENARLLQAHKTQIELLEKAYAELKAAQETIIQQEKLYTIGKLASGISHEIKNQLGVVLAVEAIKKMFPDNQKVQLYTQLIIDARNRIVSLLDEIRDFSKQKSYEKTETNLITLIQNTIDLCQFDKDLDTIKIIFTPPEEVKPIVHVNSDKIQQVLINLIRNAAHASQPKSRIEISLKQGASFWIISIKDYGCGIPEEIKDKIWEPFFTTKSHGTGLGLDICKKIIENHNGKIYFESRINEGTTFFIELPFEK